MNFLSANTRYAVQNDGTYLQQITETCTAIFYFASIIPKLVEEKFQCGIEDLKACSEEANQSELEKAGHTNFSNSD